MGAEGGWGEAGGGAGVRGRRFGAIARRRGNGGERGGDAASTGKGKGRSARAGLCFSVETPPVAGGAGACCQM